ncbi:MAG: hypothetical protein EOO43_04780 [Flavobacterium sp.]|nr:MAG: hypothetical protein EOO43_04780 [Flavobacterium sp.]
MLILGKSKSLFTEEVFEDFKQKVTRSGKIKKYLHFDDRLKFSDIEDKLRLLLSGSKKNVSNYRFLPHVKILLKTPRYKYQSEDDSYSLETKIRPITFASHFDSFIYAFYAFAIGRLYEAYIKEKGFDDCVLAYRSDLNGDCNIQFAKKAFDAIQDFSTKNKSNCVAIALDIRGYFDTINHHLLKEKWCKVIGESELPKDQYSIYRQLTNYTYCTKKGLLRHFGIKTDENLRNLLTVMPATVTGSSVTDKFNYLRSKNLIVKNKSYKGVHDSESKGIPQGSPISALLSNIYLIDFDKWLYELCKKSGGHYLRYCDDILIITTTRRAKHLIERIGDVIKDAYKLDIQTKKSDIILFCEDETGRIRSYDVNGEGKLARARKGDKKLYKNLQYLGFEYNGSKTYIRSASLSRYFRKAKGSITKTMMMAYGKRSKTDKILKKSLYEKYSHLGRRNFLSYAFNASKKEYSNSEGKIKSGLASSSIRKQLSSHFTILQAEISKTSAQFAKMKSIRTKK